jgi:hypothetical protein
VTDSNDSSGMIKETSNKHLERTHALEKKQEKSLWWSRHHVILEYWVQIGSKSIANYSKVNGCKLRAEVSAATMACYATGFLVLFTGCSGSENHKIKKVVKTGSGENLTRPVQVVKAFCS